MDNHFYKNIEKKTGVNMGEIFQLENSLQHAKLQDERTVRHIVKQVAKIANRKVPQALEDKIVETIIKDGRQLDFNTIANMLNKK